MTREGWGRGGGRWKSGEMFHVEHYCQASAVRHQLNLLGGRRVVARAKRRSVPRGTLGELKKCSTWNICDYYIVRTIIYGLEWELVLPIGVRAISSRLWESSPPHPSTALRAGCFETRGGWGTRPCPDFAGAPSIVEGAVEGNLLFLWRARCGGPRPAIGPIDFPWGQAYDAILPLL